MALPLPISGDALYQYQEVFRAGTKELVEKISVLEAAGKSTVATRAALNSALGTLMELQEFNKGWIEANVPVVYREGWNNAFASTLYATPANMGALYNEKTFAMLHKGAIESLAYAMKDRVDLAIVQVGRQVMDRYQEVGVRSTLARMFTGETIRETTARMVSEFGALGVTEFVDKAGRAWSLDAYGTMVARTTTREATTQGTLLRASRLGYELIHMSEHYPTCGICAEIEGRVYTTDENNKDYPLWHDDYCPAHPNCLHTIDVYIERYDPNKEGTLEKSNRITGDQRSPEEKNAYKSLQDANRKSSDLRNQHSRYVSRLGKDAGTIQSFSRAKNAGGAAWDKLQAGYRTARVV